MGKLGLITRYVLRTTDAPAARAFYAAVLGHERSPIVPLHEQAVARGARPHWLGQIEVEDVEATARAFVAEGAEALGPIGTFPDGRRFAVLRDPGGAIVGLTSPGTEDEQALVVFRHLHTNDPARVASLYTKLFGWRLTRRVHDAEHGEVQYFAWPGGDEDAGAILDIRGKSGRHPHWLFEMRPAGFEHALAVVRAEGGVVVGPFERTNGERIAVCDDPQGAAFALSS